MFKRVCGLATAAFVVLAVGIAAVGCGSSGDQELTQAEFAQQGNKICKEAQEERESVIKELGEKFNPNGDIQAQQSEMVLKSMPAYERAAAELEELGAPADKDKELEELVAAMHEAAVRAKQSPQTAVESDVQFKDANEVAKDLGLDSCFI